MTANSNQNTPIIDSLQKARRTGLTASTVSNDPNSKPYHPNLYRKLAHALREAGAPAPEG